MRGWLHAYGFVVALLSGIVLCALAAMQQGAAPVVSTLLYSVGACGLLGVSALYHCRRWTRRAAQIMRRLDHSMIFLFIAATYTPICVLLLPSDVATTQLAIVCGGALGGLVLKLSWPHGPRWLSAVLYVGLGWVAVGVLPDILREGGIATLALLILGGLLYSLGAVIYVLRRPNPWPRVFEHHELFHAFTLVGAVCHHVAVYFALYS